MSTTVQQPGKDSSKGWVTFKESLYITRAWDWFTTLISRAAEAILLGCFLVSLYSLIPGAPKIAPQVDAAVIIIQSITLDIAGIGLMKMSLRLKLDKKSFPYRLGQYLIAIMFVSIAVAIVRNVTGAADDNILLKIVESTLLVARAALAVLYGPAIHSLNEILREQGEEKSIASQVEERLSQAVQEEMKTLTNRFQSINGQLQSLSLLPGLQGKLAEMEGKLAEAQAFTVQEIERRFSFTAQESESKVNAFTEGIEQRLSESEREIERKVNALKAFIERQKVTVQEIPTPPSLPRKQPLQLPTRQPLSAAQPTMDREQFVHACLTEDSKMTTAEIQRRGDERSLSLSAGIVSRYRQTFTAGKSERSAVNE